MGEYKNLRFALNDKCIYLHPNNGQTLRPYNVCFTSTSSYVSITSPTFKSLQFVKLIPHSKLVPTSFTSSLKRFNALIEPVKITIPSRIKRALSVRFTYPGFTIAPATIPTLLMLNTSRTSIVEVTCSFNVGANMPSIADFTSSIAS